MLFLPIATFASKPENRQNTPELSLEIISNVIEDVRHNVNPQSTQVESNEVYLIGGTAIALLNHVVFQKDLLIDNIKDIDIAMFTDNISTDKAESWSRSLEVAGVSTKRQLSDKSWAEGKGFFHTHKATGKLIDFGMYPSWHVLEEKNGIINIERVAVQIPAGETLLTVADHIATHCRRFPSLEDLKESKYIVDNDGGFISWQDRNIKIVKKQEIMDNPVVASLRLIRLHSKLNIQMNPETKKLLVESIFNKSHDFDRIRATRHFTYFFDDANLAEELKAANEVGILRLLFPSLAHFVSNHTQDDIDKLFPIRTKDGKQQSLKDRMARMNPILYKLGAQDRALFAKELTVFYPKIAMHPAINYNHTKRPTIKSKRVPKRKRLKNTKKRFDAWLKQDAGFVTA